VVDVRDDGDVPQVISGRDAGLSLGLRGRGLLLYGHA
jgi:hypothetical protein